MLLTISSSTRFAVKYILKVAQKSQSCTIKSYMRPDWDLCRLLAPTIVIGSQHLAPYPNMERSEQKPKYHAMQRELNEGEFTWQP
jgi:hypothetical protein